MNERDVQRESLKVFFIMLLIFCLVSIYLKMISLPIGLFIGFVIGYINFAITIKVSDVILQTSQNVILTIGMFIVKTVLLIIGFALSLIVKDYINIFGVFFGYMVMPLTIHWLNYKTRKEEMN